MIFFFQNPKSWSISNSWFNMQPLNKGLKSDHLFVFIAFHIFFHKFNINSETFHIQLIRNRKTIGLKTFNKIWKGTSIQLDVYCCLAIEIGHSICLSFCLSACSFFFRILNLSKNSSLPGWDLHECGPVFLPIPKNSNEYRYQKCTAISIFGG